MAQSGQYGAGGPDPEGAMDWQRDRDKGFEGQFAHHEEVAFKAAAHRNRRLAVWAADKLQLRDKAAESYVEALVTGDVAHLRGRGIVKKIVEDFAAAKLAVAETDVDAAFDRFDAESTAQHKSD
jgi:hypothetical protein